MEKEEEMCDLNNMRQVLEMLENRMTGRRLFRYIVDGQMIDVSTEEFFCAVRKHACVLKNKKLTRPGGIIMLLSYAAYFVFFIVL